MHVNKCFKPGLLAAVVISLVACGGGGGASGGGKSSTPASVVPSSTAASSIAPSSTAISSAAPSSTPMSSSEASSSVIPSSTASSSSSSVAPEITTTFNVRINPPQLDDVAPQTKSGRKLLAEKTAQDALPLNQLAVVVVDLAGNVIRTIPLDSTNSTENPDGSWSIRVPGYPQLDCIVIADLDGPITVFDAGDNVFDSDLLFAPTTGEELEVSLASTAAYQTFVDQLGGNGTFASLGLDVTDPTQLTVVQNLIQTITDVLNDQAYIGATSITEALAQVQQQVADIVQVEASNIDNQLEPAANTLASGLQAGGVFWFEGYEPTEIYYSGFTELNVAEQERYYDGFDFVLLPEFDSWGAVVLTTEGWVITGDNFEVSALNEDGSVTLSNSEAGTDSANAKASQVINLSGRNIANFFGAYGDTRGIASQINPAATFGEGALAYRINLTATNDTYSLWYYPGYDNPADEIGGAVCPWDRNGDQLANDLASDFGGNCELVAGLSWIDGQSWANYVHNMTSMTQLLSNDVPPGTPGAKLINIDFPNGDIIAVQLIDDASKTARYYLHDWDSNTQTLVGTGTWTQQNLPNIEVDAAAIMLNIPASVIAQGNFEEGQENVLFTKHNGFLRIGSKMTQGRLLEAGELLINHVAKNSLLAAFDYQSSIAGAWVIGGDYVMFRKDGTFAQVKISNEDSNCQVGFAYGQYSWNPTTSALSVAVEEDTTAVDPLDSCSIAGIETLTIEGTTMTLVEGEDTYELTKITPSSSAPVAGAWAVGGNLFTFTGDNTFVHAKIENDDPNCRNGWASGSFTVNESTGLFTSTVEQDFTDDFEESTCTLEGEVDADLDGNSLFISMDGNEFTMKRFGHPLN